MTHGNPHEEAEHASHHAADPFDRRVAMSMVVIAAVLAAVKVAGHRTHNDTLQYQIQAGVAQSQAGTYHTQEADQWNFFQAKKMREVLAELQASQAVPELTAGKTDAQWQAEIEKNLLETRKDLDTPPEARPLGTAQEQAKKAMERVVKDREAVKKKVPGVTEAQLQRYSDAKAVAQRYRAESREILNNAVKKSGLAEEARKEAEGFREKSEHSHHKANFFDLGELGVELALVLSSVAILTKRAGYWYGGLVVGVAGIISVVMGFFQH
jgi:hypothetical protein